MHFAQATAQRDDSFIKVTSTRDAEVNTLHSELADVPRHLDKTSEQLRYAVNEIDRLHMALMSEHECSRSPHRCAPALLVLGTLALPFVPRLTDAGGSYCRLPSKEGKPVTGKPTPRHHLCGPVGHNFVLGQQPLGRHCC
jgi:hypothetical protein